MHLTEPLRQCVFSLLDQLPTPELTQLTRTVSRQLIVPESRPEAIRAVVQFSSNVAELLSRRRITRQLLMNYLIRRGDSDPELLASPQVTKLQLTQEVLWLWRCAEEPLPEPAAPESPSPEREDTPSDPDTEILTRAFCDWFFPQLNQAGAGGAALAADHFWPDAAAKLSLLSPGGCQQLEEAHSASHVTDMLSRVFLQHGVQLNPNLTASGTRGRMSRHGLLLVAVCGTVHSRVEAPDGRVVGVFQQVLGLIRDPDLQNSWRIRFLELQVTSGAVGGGCSEELGMTPTLASTGLQALLASDV